MTRLYQQRDEFFFIKRKRKKFYLILIVSLIMIVVDPIYRHFVVCNFLKKHSRKFLYVFISSIKISSQAEASFEAACPRLMYRERSMCRLLIRLLSKIFNPSNQFNCTLWWRIASPWDIHSLSVPSEWIPMVRRVYASVYEASGTMRPRNTTYPDWRNVIGPTKNGAETPGPPLHRSRVRVLSPRCSIRAGRLARFERPHLNQRCHDSYFLQQTAVQTYNFRKPWNNTSKRHCLQNNNVVSNDDTKTLNTTLFMDSLTS